MHPEQGGQPSLGAAEFDELYRRLQAKAIWGASDGRGALNYITSVQVRAAAREIRSGRTVTLAAPMETDPSPHNPEPSKHNGVAAQTTASAGATTLSSDEAHNGIVGRGVLLDIPRRRHVSWLEPGDHVTADDLSAAEGAEGLRVGRGDLLFVRVGHRRRRSKPGRQTAAVPRAGLDPTALELLADRQVALLGSDGNNDTAPSTTEGVQFPVHTLAVNAMGLHLLDYLQFEDLVAICEQQRRWSFLCVIAPLRLSALAGSPVNPIAIL